MENAAFPLCNEDGIASSGPMAFLGALQGNILEGVAVGKTDRADVVTRNKEDTYIYAKNSEWRQF